MSQNPQNNPYGQGQPDPKYPAQSGYPPTPNPNYGQYAPPPPPVPDPESIPYGPYDQTVMSQRSGQSYPVYPPPPDPGPTYPAYHTPPDLSPTYPVAGNSGPAYSTYPTPPGSLDFHTPPGLPPAPPAKKSNARVVLISVVALLLIVGGVMGFVLYNNHVATANHDATATAQSQAQGTGTANAYASATVNAQSTATYIKTHYPFSSDLVLNDTLKDNSGISKYGWAVNSQCTFTNSSYQAVPQPNFIQLCTAENTNFANFTYEVQMTIKSGASTGSGGIFFRGNAAGGQLYIFFLGADGFYDLYRRASNQAGTSTKLREGTVPAFNGGFFQVHTIGVVANGSNISVYVDQKQITQVTDTTYTSGQIGVIADYDGSPTVVDYNNAKVWKL
ncbi:MAG TPA: hypothetical protein VF458_11645 [Ktedonobacteraceae bacterium]